MNRAAIVIVGIMFSIGLLLIGFISLEIIKGKEENFGILNTVKEPTEKEEIMKVSPEIEGNVQVKSLPNAEDEAYRWNKIVKDQFGTKAEYMFDPKQIEKEEKVHDDQLTTFTYAFENSLDIRIVYIVDNKTREITEIRLVGYELAGADRAAIFHAMSVFISYVDGDVSLSRAGEYLGGIPFATAKDGLHEVEFNGKKYDFVLDFANGLNMLVYRIGE